MSTDKISLRAAAKAIGKGHTYIRQLVDQGKVRAWKHGSRLEVYLEELEAAVRDDGQVPQMVRDVWKAYQPFMRIPECVYFCYHHGALVYIGTTTDLHSRLAQHFKNGRGKSMDAVFYLEALHGTAGELESILVAQLNPPLNGNCPRKLGPRWTGVVKKHCDSLKSRMEARP